MSIRTLFFKAKMQRGKNALSLLVFSSLFVFGFFAGSFEVNAQPYGSCGWCPCGIDTCDGGWSMGVNGPYGTSPGNLSACPVSGGGCLAGQNGYCTGSDGSYYSYSCENSGGGDGGTMTCSEVDTPVLSYSCNATGTQATISIAGRSMNNMFSSRVDVLSPSWGNRCPATSPDLCETRSSFTVNIVPGMPNNAWAHPWQGCGGYGLERTDIVGSISFVCSPPPPPAPVPDLRINGSNGPLAVSSGANLNLTWGAVANATSCRAIAGSGWAVASKDQNGGNDNIPATITSTYTLSCTGAGGTGTDSVVVNVNVPPPPPIANPISSATCSPAGNSVTISWNAVPTATNYSLRINDEIDPWGPRPGQGCAYSTSPNDTCLDSIFSRSYSRPVVPGHTYQSWMHACRPGDCSPGLGTVPYPFRCNAPTLTVGVTATPASEIAPFSSDIQASVTGTATGNITYTFDCGNGAMPTPPPATFTSALTTVRRRCAYSSAGTYAPKVTAVRQGVTDTGQTIVQANAPLVTCGGRSGLYSTLSTNWKAGTFCNPGTAPQPSVTYPSAPIAPNTTKNWACGSNSCSATWVCAPTTTCTASNICRGESCDNGCGTITDGTKDCRKFWKEVAP